MSHVIRSEVTVAELAEHGIDSVDAFCEKCGNSWRAPIYILPPATTLARVAALMACPNCGGRHVDVTPASQEERPTGH
jgi:Zn finger protein HypA/HybF involved in hydrogenase expression